MVIYDNDTELGRIPLHNLEAIVSFGYRGMSPALMGGCAERDISLCVLSPQGRFLARVTGRVRGNVLLRRKQYQVSMNQDASLTIARNCILGKVYNARWVLERAVRDHGLQIDTEKVKEAAGFLKQSLRRIEESRDMAQLRGMKVRMQAFIWSFRPAHITAEKDFYFKGRNRRPPLDNVNAMLSFVYTLLANTVASALETVGLDPYVGFMHTDRPGRLSLALDLMEELRPVLADRFVLTLINRKMVNKRIFPERRRRCHHERRGAEAFVVRMAEQEKGDDHPSISE